MKVNKLYASIALSSVLALTGCGGDDNGEYIVGSNDNGSPLTKNELNYTVFDAFTDVSDDDYIDGWGKLAYKFNNNSFTEITSTVVGSSYTAYQDSRGDNDALEYYVGTNVFAAIPEDFDSKFYKIKFVDSDTFKLNIHSGNASINSTYDIITLDLAGVGKQPFNAKTGIDTDLSSFPIGVNPVFPNGSQCYILLETPDQNFYTFSEDEDEGNITIDEWLAKRQKYNTVTNLVKENVGLNNELPAVRYTDENGDTIAAVRYKGLIYAASYHQKGVQEKFDIDPDISEVYCGMYNDVAATFFEKQIKANY